MKEACKLLGVSRVTVNRRVNNDPTFPRPIKDGVTRQAAVYFVLGEIEAWIQVQMDSRGAA
jgi:prophage regulatory protein